VPEEELFPSLAGMCPASPVLGDGVKGHRMNEKYLTGKPRPLGRGASLCQCPDGISDFAAQFFQSPAIGSNHALITLPS
jgi:hypothetical protein